MKSLQTLKPRFKQFKEQDKSDSGDPVAASMIIIGVMVLVALAIYLTFAEAMFEEEDRLTSGQSNVSESDSDSEPAPAPQEPAAPAPQEPAEPIDWQPLVYVGTGLLGLVALGGGGFIVVKGGSAANRARKAKKTEKEQETQRRNEIIASWKAVVDRHNDVLVEYSEYETDVWKALNYPALHDVEVEETSAFLRVMRDASTLERTLDKSKPIHGSKELYKDYEQTVSDLEDKFVLAKNKAYRLGESNLSSEEQKDIRTAKNLLKHAEDAGNNNELRSSYYEQLRRVINRLNERHKTPIIPQATFDVLEQRTRLLLTDGNNDSETVNVVNLNKDTSVNKKQVIEL